MIRLVISGFQLSIGFLGFVGFVVKAAVGQWPAKFLVKEKEQQGHLDTLIGKKVGVASAIALDQAMGFQFAQIVTKLVDPILLGGQLEGAQDRFMNLLGGPTTNPGTSVKEDFHQTDNAGIVNLDAGKLDRAVSDG